MPGAHCSPLGRVGDVLGAPWTLAVIRELLRGDAPVADLALRLPGMSTHLLKRRLRHLNDLGLIDLRIEDGRRRYGLSDAGHALRGVVDELESWARRWLPPPRAHELDTTSLIHDVCCDIDPVSLPTRPATVHIRFAEAPPPSDWWIMLDRDGANATSTEVTTGVSVRIRSTLHAFVNVWLGHVRCSDAVREGSIQFSGTPEAVRSAVHWLGFSRSQAPTVPNGSLTYRTP